MGVEKFFSLSAPFCPAHSAGYGDVGHPVGRGRSLGLVLITAERYVPVAWDVNQGVRNALNVSGRAEFEPWDNHEQVTVPLQNKGAATCPYLTR